MGMRLRRCCERFYRRVDELRRKLRLLRGMSLVEKDKKKKWIQDVVKRAERKGTKGAFREWCLKQGFRGVNKSCIQKAKKVARETGDITLLRRAVAAENMMKASGVLD